MLGQLTDPFLVFAGITAALVAGVFLTFSDFVMRGLGTSAPAAGAEAMQQVNREVYRSVFMVLFLGSLPMAVAIFSLAFTTAFIEQSVWMITGSLSYVLGVFAVTAIGNVPMNQRLDALDHRSGEGQAYWLVYKLRWTRLNHVRTLCSVVTATSYLIAAMA